MKTSTAIILLLSAHLITAQLNFEGNPLTEHTDYVAEESNLSERESRQKNLEPSINGLPTTNQVSSNESPQKLYPVYTKVGKNVILQVKPFQNEEPIKTSEPNQSSMTIESNEKVQIVEPEKKPEQSNESTIRLGLSRHFQDNFINSNVIQQEKSYQQQSINPADTALQIFLNSKYPEESQLALDYYLKGSQGLGEKLEFQQQQQMREKELQQQMREKELQEHLRQQQLQQELSIQQQQLKQDQAFQAQQENLRQHQIQLQRAQQQKMMEQEHIRQQIQQQQNQFQNQQQIQLHNQQQIQLQNQQQIQMQNQQIQMQNQQIQLPNQQMNPQIQPEVQQQKVNPLAQTVPQASIPFQVPLTHSYSASRFPISQPRNDFYPGPPVYRKPMRSNYRPPVPLQPRVGPGIYKSPSVPPNFPGKIVKPPVEIIYSRPPTYARGAPIISKSPGRYEDASPWFPESDHQPPAKDIYYSQLYAQSYDPHYYNYIAKTGKIKPYLYGKLKGEENKDNGILSDLYQGFKEHGIKNIMNPTFLLGMTIPALTFMLTALVQKRSLARSDSRSFDQEEIREYLERLQRALECYHKSGDERCWR